MDKQEIVHVLEDIGTLLELQGESPFKSRAYTTGARVIAGLDTAQLQELVRSGKLRSLKGIGAALAEKINELVTTGHLTYYETLKQQVPAGLLEMLTIPGMGPKKVKAIYDQLTPQHHWTVRPKQVPVLSNGRVAQRISHRSSTLPLRPSCLSE